MLSQINTCIFSENNQNAKEDEVNLWYVYYIYCSWRKDSSWDKANFEQIKPVALSIVEL